jgi:hypothetical protein
LVELTATLYSIYPIALARKYCLSRQRRLRFFR